MKILVTGGSGFIGSNTIMELLRKGYSVVNYDIKPPFFEPEVQLEFEKYVALGRYEWYCGDIRDKNDFYGLLYQCDGLIHLAGVLGTAETMNSLAETADINVVGTLRVFETVKMLKKKAVYITIGNDWENPYTITKTAAARFALMLNREFGTKITVIRGLNVYGPRQKWMPVNKFFPRFVVNALKGIPIPIFGDGEQLIDVVYVKDMAEALIKALETDFGPEQYEQILDAGTGYGLSVNEVVKKVVYACNPAAKDWKESVKYLPMRPGEPIKSATLGKVSKINEILGFVAKTPIDEGFKTSVEWYKRNYKLMEKLA